jgi:putative DNA primase/helicase
MAFLREQCVLGPDQQVGIAELFARWQVWCQAAGRTHPGTEQSFARDLWAAVPQLRPLRPTVGGRRTRCYGGIGLRPG